MLCDHRMSTVDSSVESSDVVVSSRGKRPITDVDSSGSDAESPAVKKRVCLATDADSSSEASTTNTNAVVNTEISTGETNSCEDSVHKPTDKTNDDDVDVAAIDDDDDKKQEQLTYSTTAVVDELKDEDELALNLSKTVNSDDVTPVLTVQPAEVGAVANTVTDESDGEIDTPIDLSRHPKSSHAVNGSDNHKSNANGIVNGVNFDCMIVDSVPSRLSIKQLQDELRNEETKLVLLKKIRQSQAVHRLMQPDGVAKSSSVSSALPAAIAGPPPLIRGGSHVAVSQSHRVSHHSSDVSRLHAQLPPASYSVHHSSSHGPPPLIMAPRQSPITATTTRSIPIVSTAIAQNMSSSAHGYRSTVAPTVPEQSAAQRQAAAKLALRRQLEKTLLQIPPPKPPPPEMNFIPNINTNAEFVMLVGLEEAVKCIMDGDSHAIGDSVTSGDVKYVFTPFECVQCQTDYTPVWKRDRPGSKSVICERCVTTNQKRALKQEHTNRLKGAFVRALQQEQEIEQSLQAAGGAVTPPPANNKVYTTIGNLKPASDSSRTYQGIAAHQSAPNLRTSVGTTSLPIGSIGSLTMPSTAVAAFNAGRLLFPYQRSPVPANRSSTDLQRQFLLDMIPRRPPVDGQVIWRT